ncbi:hypothetical protein AWC38_SpisGene21626 [Stylophora pistillata]|uniref:Integrase catalytic domain-containing protein n=1 Tax=Stylophora pistillata TaxID=50429 RepID=A0A2B4RBP9_STYPI|nr:hypothetical protein AWC38_SpisGene21626 [Stylophora pistillata]
MTTIHERSRADQWYYVGTGSNPADDASRGLSTEELIHKNRWTSGPSFLLEAEDCSWPKQPDVPVEIKGDDPEVKKERKTFSVASTVEVDFLNRMVQSCSSWYRLKKLMAWILRYRSNLLRECRGRKEARAKVLISGKPSPISVEEMHYAEIEVLKKSYWIIKGRVAMRRVVNHCFSCRRRQAPSGAQKMADLPADRVTPDKPPFSFVGVDSFGPFWVKRARSQVKRYGVLFTCLGTRAIHLKVAQSMDTDSFVNSLRRFNARRGIPEVMRSENRSNFVSGNKELREPISEWNESRIHEFFLQRNIKWLFNPPSGSHFGGIWERCIRTVRKTLLALVKEQPLDDEWLTTLMCEVESVINGRSITKSSGDLSESEALTPNHLLLLRSGPNLPPGVFSKEDGYSRGRLRQAQYMTTYFGEDGLKSTCRSCRRGRNGLIHHRTLPLMT